MAHKPKVMMDILGEFPTRAAHPASSGASQLGRGVAGEPIAAELEHLGRRVASQLGQCAAEELVLDEPARNWSHVTTYG